MKLMYAPQSPFARKVRMAAIELGLGDQLELEYMEVVPGKTDRLFSGAINPLGKIPVLVLEDGNTLSDSTVICEYLDGLCGGGVILPGSGFPRARALSDAAAANGMCEALIQIRYETWLRPEAKRWDVWLSAQWQKIWSVLHACESQALSFFKEPQGLELAHITLACALGYLEFRFPDHDWRGRFPKVAKWLAGVRSRPSFLLTLPRDPSESDKKRRE